MPVDVYCIKEQKRYAGISPKNNMKTGILDRGCLFGGKRWI